MRRLLRQVRRARGQSMVEFALVLPIFAILLFGIIDFGRYVFTANALNNGAREAARFASVSVFPAEQVSSMVRSAGLPIARTIPAASAIVLTNAVWPRSSGSMQ